MHVKGRRAIGAFFDANRQGAQRVPFPGRRRKGGAIFIGRFR